MKKHNLILSVLSVLVAVALIACGGGEPEKKAAAPVLKATKAKVSAAKQTGTDSGKPIIEFTGTLPGTGWEPELVVEETAEGTLVRVMAVPGPGAVKGADTPFTHKLTLEGVPAGKAVRVMDHRGVEIKRIEVK